MSSPSAPHHRVARHLQWLFVIIPAVCFLGFLLLRRFARLDYYTFVREDGFIENLQSLFFALAALGAGMLARRFFRSADKLFGIAFSFLCAGLLFVAAEEISWGQRIFGIETPPELAEANIQGEITVHNLKALGNVVHKVFILVGLYTVFGRGLVWLFARPLLSTRWSHILVDWYIVPFFMPFLAVYVTYEYLNAIIEPHYGFPVILWQDLETAEFFLASGFLAFIVSKMLQVPAPAQSPAAVAQTQS